MERQSKVAGQSRDTLKEQRKYLLEVMWKKKKDNQTK